MTAKTTIADLPNELLSQIVSFLDVAVPSATRLHDQPSPDLLRLDPSQRNLKGASLVSQLWRSVALPLLFKHVLWYLDAWDFPALFDGIRNGQAPPPLKFLRDKGLGGDTVESFVVVLEDSKGSYPDVTIKFLGLDLTGRDESLAYGREYNWLWASIFEAVNPLRFTLIARPRLMATVLSRTLYLCDEWSFELKEHVLSLSRHERIIPPTCAPDTHRPESSSSHLFVCRPWTGVLLNEGSQTRVYKTYEFYLKRPPSILAALLGAEENFPNNYPLLGPYISDFSYVAIFPLSSHFQTLVENLPSHLDRLFVQLVPRNDILRDGREMKHIDTNDLWMERNTAYSMLMKELFNPSPQSRWLDLKVFESGDSADKVVSLIVARFMLQFPSSNPKIRPSVPTHMLVDPFRTLQDPPSLMISSRNTTSTSHVYRTRFLDTTWSLTSAIC